MTIPIVPSEALPCVQATWHRSILKPITLRQGHFRPIDSRGPAVFYAPPRTPLHERSYSITLASASLQTPPFPTSPGSAIYEANQTCRDRSLCRSQNSKVLVTPLNQRHSPSSTAPDISPHSAGPSETLRIRPLEARRSSSRTV